MVAKVRIVPTEYGMFRLETHTSVWVGWKRTSLIYPTFDKALEEAKKLKDHLNTPSTEV